MSMSHAQAPDPQSRRIDDRLRALQRENEQLAREATTLVGELRKLEIQRDLRVEEWMRAEAAAADAQAVVQAGERLATLELQRTAQLPDLRAQLVDVYKRGRSGYARLIFGADDLRDFARTTRAVAALASINERRIADHRRTLQELTAQRAALEQSAAQLRAREAEARTARAAADRAVADLSAHIARIDSRRDLTAHARESCRWQTTNCSSSSPPPIQDVRAKRWSSLYFPFRGTLEWPAGGRLAGRFGQATDRLGGTAVRNGIEIAVPENTPVRAVHGGTVGLAGPFIGFGNLVIVEHGANNYSLYGYLGTIGVERGDTLDAGAELGRSGSAPAGPPALYFEMRIDGRPVDPVQWLKSK